MTHAQATRRTGLPVSTRQGWRRSMCHRLNCPVVSEARQHLESSANHALNREGYRERCPEAPSSCRTSSRRRFTNRSTMQASTPVGCGNGGQGSRGGRARVESVRSRHALQQWYSGSHGFAVGNTSRLIHQVAT